MKSWLQDDNIEMYSVHSEGKSVVAGRFIRTFKLYVVSGNIPFSAKAFLILPMSTFFWKKKVFLGKSGTFTQSNSMRAVLDIF